MCRDQNKKHKMCVGGCMNDCKRAGQGAGKWTPGPWVFNYHDGSVMAGPNTIGYVEVNEWHHLGMGESNAHLIAAAPELYEALYKILRAHNNEVSGGFLNPGEKRHAEIALAKARGEQK